MLPAQTPASNARAIDCHHHFASPEYLKALTAKEGHLPRGSSDNLTPTADRSIHPPHNFH
jgi:hypothetical protein